jgi:hypothetical protein
LGAIESELRPEFNIRVHGYNFSGNKKQAGIVQSDASSQSQSQSHSSFSSHSPIVPRAGAQQDEDGHVTVSMFWMGDADPVRQVGMTYIKEMVVPLFPTNATRDNVIYYYFSWSAMSRQQVQDETWQSVFSAQSWNGFLLPSNNTMEVWEDIQESMKALLRYTKYTSPKIELWGGKISKILPNATAFPHRNALYNIALELLIPVGSDSETASDEANLIQAIWPSIARHLDGVYVNNPMRSLSEADYALAYWGKNLDRLKQIKQQYDPFHVLTFSQSIPILSSKDMVH